MVPWLRLATPGLKSQGEPEQRRQVLDHAKRVPGLSLRTEIFDAEGALNLAFPFRLLGFIGGGEHSDSLDASGEYALAEPGKPRFERPYENGTILVDSGAAGAFT